MGGRTICPACGCSHVRAFPNESLCLKCGRYFDPYEGLYGQALGEAVLHDLEIQKDIAAWERGEEEE